MKLRKIIGACLIVMSIITFLIIAAVNKFSIKHCWVVSCSVDRLLVFVGILAVIFGAICIAKDDKDKNE